MNALRENVAPKLNDMSRATIGTGHTHEAVLLSFAEPVTLIMFTPKEAREMSARILELADCIDNGQGWS